MLYEVITIGDIAEMEIRFENALQRCLLFEDLPETAVGVGQLIGETGQGTLLPLLLQVRQLELFGKDPPEIVGARLDFMGSPLPLPCTFP